MRPGPRSRIFRISVRVPVPRPANFEFQSGSHSRILRWVPVQDFRDRDCEIPGTFPGCRPLSPDPKRWYLFNDFKSKPFKCSFFFNICITFGRVSCKWELFWVFFCSAIFYNYLRYKIFTSDSWKCRNSNNFSRWSWTQFRW